MLFFAVGIILIIILWLSQTVGSRKIQVGTAGCLFLAIVLALILSLSILFAN